MTMDKSIAIFDDHPVLGAGLQSTLNKLSGLHVDLVASDLMQLLEDLKAGDFDLLIADVVAPGLEGLQLFHAMEKEMPNLPVIAYTSLNNISLMRQLYQLNVKGFVNKRESIAVLTQAIEAVLAGGYYYPFTFKVPVSGKKPSFDAITLTTRELEILRLIADGFLSKEIAHQLQLSINTVNVHRGNLFNKFQVQNAGELIREASRLGYIEH